MLKSTQPTSQRVFSIALCRKQGKALTSEEEELERGSHDVAESLSVSDSQVPFPASRPCRKQ